MPIRIAYGDDALQFGDLWLPDDAGPLPTVVLIHGGFWRNRYGLDLMDPLAADLAARGFAAWNVEYRRVGDPGGGWPGTFDDVAAAVDHVAAMAEAHGLDASRVALVGHSAGGHLALWSAGRDAPAVAPSVAIGQGPVVDVIACAEAGLSNGAAIELLGGTPDEVPERYAFAAPHLSAGPRMVAVVGSEDVDVPPSFSDDPRQPGAVEIVTIVGADHFDLIDPTHPAWAAVVERCRTGLVRRGDRSAT
jgi:acetyl esterase/lipase